MGNPSRAAKVVIKKYANRRLYDTSGSRYVNLEDIAALIRNGTEVQVVDANTGADLTRVTLTQIIVEDAKDTPAGLPLDLLRQLIMASDQVRQEFMKSAFETYYKMQNALESGLADVRSAAMTPLQAVSSFVQSAAGQKREESEMEELRKRIAELEGRVGGARKKRPPRKRKV
jgi:polyhydroxyalkanoate synthesis repressor PhaR